MITIKSFMECVDFKVTDGCNFGWQCFGPNAYQLDSWNGLQDSGYSISIVFDTKTHIVYEMEAWDYNTHRSYRWIHPDYVDAVKAESATRGYSFANACDDEDFIDLEVEDDILEKARAIVAGEEYDAKTMINLNLEDDLLFEAMKLAHEADMTFNDYIAKVLREFIDDTSEFRN